MLFPDSVTLVKPSGLASRAVLAAEMDARSGEWRRPVALLTFWYQEAPKRVALSN